jgi:hypothetical protein
MGRVRRRSSRSYGNCSDGIAFGRRCVIFVVGAWPSVGVVGDASPRYVIAAGTRLVSCAHSNNSILVWRQRGAERAVQDGRLGKAEMR